MNIQKSLFPALLVCALLALQLFIARPVQAQPMSAGASFDGIDAYIEEQLKALNISGARRRGLSEKFPSAN